jgi:hypothetical protein
MGGRKKGSVTARRSFFETMIQFVVGQSAKSYSIGNDRSFETVIQFPIWIYGNRNSIGNDRSFEIAIQIH